MARVFLSAFIDATLKGKSEYLPIFRDHRTIGTWLPKTMYATRFQDADFHALADFDEDVDVTTGSAPGVVITGDSLATWKEAVLPLRSAGNVGGFAVWLGWNNQLAGKDTTRLGPPAAYSVTISDSLREAWRVGTATALQFSLAVTDDTPAPRKVAKDTTKADGDSTATTDSSEANLKTSKPKPKKEVKDSTPVDLSIQVVDTAGVAVSLPVSRHGVARRPLEVTVLRRAGADKSRFGSLAELIPQTFVIRLTDFRARDPRFDPTALTSIRWVFDQSKAGTVVLSDIGLSNMAPTFFVPGAK